jgi:hypothetical protein
MSSIVPVDRLEIVCNGRVMKRLVTGKARTTADVSGTLSLKSSGWCLLRANSDHAEYPVLDNYVYATTSPVYVKVAGESVRSAQDAEYFLSWLDRVQESVVKYPDWNTAAEQVSVLDRLNAAREIYAKLR